MINYDKQDVRNALTLENVFELLQEFNADPQYMENGIVCSTICHNHPGEGSHKLYYYENSKLFVCFTHCPEPFDIFDLTIKVKSIQNNEEWEFNTAVRWIAKKFGIDGTEVSDDDEKLDDWKYFDNYQRIQDIEFNITNAVLKEYDTIILTRFNYNVIIEPWVNDGISQEVMRNAQIGYYPGEEQITIPHFDANNRFIGLRGRALVRDEALKYGKYRPMKILNTLYSHPLGLNLYGLNWSKNNIKLMKKVIVFESEKSVLRYATLFGWENNLSVAICGSNISAYQIKLLKDAGAEEIVLALDKQYEKLNSDECKLWQTKLLKIREKYKSDALISFMWDKYNKLDYKDSPIDKDLDTFMFLFKNRIIL